VRARTGNEILKGFRSLEQRQAQLQLPILAVHGTNDRCTSLPVHPLSSNVASICCLLHQSFVKSQLVVLTDRLCIAVVLFQSYSPDVILYHSLTYMTPFHHISICACSSNCSDTLHGLCAGATSVSRALFMHSPFCGVLPHGTQQKAWITQRQHRREGKDFEMLVQAVKRLLQACQSKDITLNEMPGGYHELIMGPEKEQVIPMVTEWILAHAGTAAAKM
jgi:hypothetical protein